MCAMGTRQPVRSHACFQTLFKALRVSKKLTWRGQNVRVTDVITFSLELQVHTCLIDSNVCTQ